MTKDELDARLRAHRWLLIALMGAFEAAIGRRGHFERVIKAATSTIGGDLCSLGPAAKEEVEIVLARMRGERGTPPGR